MGIKLFSKLIIETLNPYRYKGLSQRSLLKTMFFFLSISLVYLILIGAVNTPRYYSNYISENMSGMKEFKININIETKAPIVISESPKIVVDTIDNRTLQKKEDIVITKDTIYSKVMFWTKKTNYSEYDVLSNINKLKRNIILLALVFIPSILFIAYLFTIIKYLLIIFLFSLIALVAVIIGNYKIKTLEILKSAVYSLTIYYLVNIVASIIGIRYLGLIVYIIFFSVALFFMRDNISHTPAMEEDE